MSDSRQVTRVRYLKTTHTEWCTGWGIFKKHTNNVDWHKVVDVDLEKDCCFGHGSTRDAAEGAEVLSFRNLGVWRRVFGFPTLKIHKTA